ncbi:MAG TPA: threonine synthase [Cyclobacteriaceae bacterium]|nr:threonine synthase [Cyclobacteriaceae bacterium]HRK54339.1 threonine synthase [Cyclobacteriaceae bacterium]
MLYYSSNGKSPKVGFEEAVLQGLAPDNGLYFPASIPKLSTSFFRTIEELNPDEIAFQVAKQFVGDEIPEERLKQIVKEVLNFSIPLVKVEKDIYSLELFHGPTLAFKDIGARFMARVLRFFLEKKSKSATILVATSGDTGGAVASGFYDVEGINVVILYPSGKISMTQEKQLTTWGKNIHALEIDGTFDDCQKLVKEAFADSELKAKYGLTSANSINIARLLPQSFYYFLAYQQIKDKSKPFIVSVPSGNLGNLTAGLIAWQMGLPVNRFVVASNSNDVITKYLHTGLFESKPSVLTVANAMDVGNPSNFARVLEIFNHNYDRVKDKLIGYSFSDSEIKNCIAEVYQKTKYTLDPHGACAYMGLKKELKESETGIFLETAHPAKFSETVSESIGQSITIPDSLNAIIVKKKTAIQCMPSLDDLRGVFNKVL